MSEHAYGADFRVRGEDAPVWLPWVFFLLGLVGSVISAHLYLGDRRDTPAQLSTPIEIGAGAIQVVPPVAEAVRAAGSESTDPRDEPDATPDQESGRPSVAIGAALVVEQTSETLIAATSSPPQSAERGLEPGESSAVAGSSVVALDSEEGAAESTPTQQIGSGPAREAEAGTTVKVATDHTPTGTDTATDLPVKTDAASSDSQPTQADDQTQAAQPIVTASEPQVALVSPSAAIAGAEPFASDQTGREHAGSLGSQAESAEPPEARESRQASKPGIKGQPNALQAGPQHGNDIESEHRIDQIAVDCAPLFSLSFNHGSVEPQGRDLEKKIKRLARWLSAHPTATVYVDGHADPSGSEEINLVISFRRAVATAALLTQAGASQAQLVVRAYGEGTSLSPSVESQPERRVTLAIDTSMSCGQRASTDGGPL